MIINPPVHEAVAVGRAAVREEEGHLWWWWLVVVVVV